MAQLYSKRAVVRVIRKLLQSFRFVCCCADMIRALGGWYALYDFALHPDDEMGTCVAFVPLAWGLVLETFKIIAVLRGCCAGVCNPMNDDAFHVVDVCSGARKWVACKQISFYIHGESIRRKRAWLLNSGTFRRLYGRQRRQFKTFFWMFFLGLFRRLKANFIGLFSLFFVSDFKPKRRVSGRIKA